MSLCRPGPSPPPSLPPAAQGLTERCWNNHALMMLVATLGKIPLFLFRRRSWSSSSSSPPELGEATLVSSPSPENRERQAELVDREGGGQVGPRTRPQASPCPPSHPRPSGSPTCCLTPILRLTPTFPLRLSSNSPWSLALSPLWEARPPLDGPGVPKCTDPLSSWSLIHVLFWKKQEWGVSAKAWGAE